jgi:ketosteroid isomerase-like protein
MARTEPEDIVRKYTAAKERRDLDAAAALLDPNVLSYDPSIPEPVKGREACRKASEILAKIPDLKIRILNILSKGDEVAGEFITTFTMPPTGRRIELRYAKFFRVNSRGLIEEEREYSDSAEKEKQLGQTAYAAFLSQVDDSANSGD